MRWGKEMHYKGYRKTSGVIGNVEHLVFGELNKEIHMLKLNKLYTVYSPK